MSDLISRGQLFNLLAPVQTLGEAYGIIQEMPPVDAVPVVHGRWVYTRSRLHKKCSECQRIYANGESVDNFCPNCGADMKKDGDHAEGIV